jgi:hypothetical protein
MMMIIITEADEKEKESRKLSSLFISEREIG